MSVHNSSRDVCPEAKKKGHDDDGGGGNVGSSTVQKERIFEGGLFAFPVRNGAIIASAAD